MVGEQNPQDIRELTAWLEADDAKSRAMRATRLRDLLDILPVPSDGLSFLGGEQSVLCFEEIRRCYLDRSDMAVVLLCLAYVDVPRNGTSGKETRADHDFARGSQVIIGSQIGNVANASPAAEQSAQIDVETGDLAGLVKALSTAGVPSDEVDTLRAAIEGQSGETARQECDGWLNRGKQAVASGAWSLAQGVTIATIREAVTAYLRSG